MLYKTLFDFKTTNWVIVKVFHKWEVCARLPMTEMKISVKVYYDSNNLNNITLHFWQDRI
jgi:hypothetical protein